MKFTTKKSLVLSAILLLGAGVFLVFSQKRPLLEDGNGQKAPVISLENPQTYQEPQGGGEKNKFTFNYPQKFNLTSQDIEGGGKKILVESTEPQKGFEITVLPFDEVGPLTAARIKQDIPDMVMGNQKSVIVGAEKIPALAFNSTDENIGNTFEIWFVYNGSLYQALTYPEFSAGMEEILKTWQFK
jgi:hypothetical protein